MQDESDDKPGIGKARNIARGLLKKAEINHFPILLKDVAKHVEGLHIDGKELQDGISGMQATYKGRSFVRYNSSHPVKRNRFTVAHELGHHLLGHTSGCGRGTNSSSPQEVEANQFAAELLMPLQLLKESINNNNTVSKLARLCWVSNEAMSNRVMETGLYKKLASWD